MGAQVEILNKGEMGFIGVGFMTEEVQLARLPGWEAHSYGERQSCTKHTKPQHTSTQETAFLRAPACWSFIFGCHVQGIMEMMAVPSVAAAQGGCMGPRSPHWTSLGCALTGLTAQSSERPLLLYVANLTAE